MPVTPILQLPYPALTDTANNPRDIEALADKLDDTLPSAFAQSPPIGALMMWLTASAPTNWLLCQGQQVPSATYPKLAEVLNQTTGQITLPDLQGRLPVGSSATRGLGSVGGVETVALAESQIPSHAHGASAWTDAQGYHAHGVYDPGHAHSSLCATGTASRGSANYGGGGGESVAYTNHVHGLSWQGVTGSGTGIGIYADGQHAHNVGVSVAAAGGSGAHENMPPYTAVNFIIRAQ